MTIGADPVDLATGEDRTCIYTSETWETTVLVSRLEGILVVVLPRHIVFSRLKSKPNYKNFPDNYMHATVDTRRFSVLLRYNYLDTSSPTKYCDCEAMFIDHSGWGDGWCQGRLVRCYQVGSTKVENVESSLSDSRIGVA
jgi:hypothetical protein